VRAERSGYLTLRYGQTRPLEQGRPLDVAERATIEKVDFTLPRAGVIAGRVVDEFGDPVADVPVFAMRTAYWQGRRRTVPSGNPTRTDDAGMYRISGLMPGTYQVMAVLRETWTVRERGVEQTLGYAPTYSPGIATIAEATRITLGVGQQLNAVDVSLVAGRAASISGTAIDAGGRPLAGRTVALGREIAGPDSGSFMAAGNATVAGDGSFAIKVVPPGQYKIRVQAATPSGNPTTGPEMIVMPIAIDGIDLTNVTLATLPPWSVAARLVTDAGAPPAARFDGFALEVVPVEPDVTPDVQGRGADDGRVQNDWTVRFSRIFGAARLHVRTPDGWWVRSMLRDGVDITDAPTEMRGGEELSDVRIVVNDHPTRVRGQVVDAKGAPMAVGTVVVFARDPQKWFEQSRWVRAVRPDQAGNYVIDGLPPGDYFAAVIDYVEDGMWNDPAFVESLHERAEPFALTEGESHTLTLKYVTP